MHYKEQAYMFDNNLKIMYIDTRHTSYLEIVLIFC